MFSNATLASLHAQLRVSFHSYDTHALQLCFFATHNALLYQLCAKGTYLVVALLVHCISQPRAFTGKAACSLWCGYRIVYCAIPARDPSLINVSLFVLVLCHSSRAGYGTYTITAHHYAALSLLLYLCILLR